MDPLKMYIFPIKNVKGDSRDPQQESYHSHKNPKRYGNGMGSLP